MDACGKLNMGKGSMRFKKVDRPLAAMPLLSQLFEQMSPEAWIARYEGTFNADLDADVLAEPDHARPSSTTLQHRWTSRSKVPAPRNRT